MASAEPSWAVSFVAHSGVAEVDAEWVGAMVIHSGASDVNAEWVGATIVHSGASDVDVEWIGAMVVHTGIAAGGGGSPIQGDNVQYDPAQVQGFTRQGYAGKKGHGGGQINNT